MKIRIVYLLGIIFLLCLFTGCMSEKDEVSVIPSISFAPLENEEKNIILDVYWDSTYSMKGYTTISQDNAYRSLPDDLDDIGNSM